MRAKPKDDLAILEELLGISFRDKSLLVRALTHRSYRNENRTAEDEQNNEHLEFLGDAVIEIVVTEYLFRRFDREADTSEGGLTRLRSALVSSEALIEVAQQFDLPRFLRCSNGERQDFLRSTRKKKLLADVLEAIIGAFYLDRGRLAAEMFVLETIVPRLEKLQAQGIREPKSDLQELMQARRGVTPHYRELSQNGPEHTPWFTVGVFAGKDRLATGQGPNKKIAETKAAEEAMKRLLLPG